MLHRMTINTLLKAVIATLGAAVVIMLSFSAWESWGRLSVASRATAVADASSYLFTALHNLRFDRAVSRTELLADRQATTMNAILREARTNEMPALKSALVALERVDLADRDAVIAALAEHIKRLTALHEETAVAMAQPKSARRPGLAEEMFKEADDLIKFIDKTSTQLTQSIKLQDPYIDQLMELKQLAWVVRNNAGDSAVLVSYALEGRPQTAANVEDYIAKTSTVRSTWAVLEDLASGLPLPAAFTQMREKVEHEYFASDYISAGMKMIKDALAGLPPPMNVDQWTAMGMTRLTPLVDVAEAALDAARAHAASQQSAALRSLIVQMVLLIGAIALFVGAMMVVTGRVTNPLRKLSESMRKLAGGDFDVVLPGLERKDEIGAMANAVEEFKVLALEKARRETDEAMQRQQAEVEIQAKAASEQRKQAEAQAQAAEEQARIVRLLADGLVKMSEGDLTHRLGEGFSDSYRQIKDDFNAMAAQLQETIGSIVVATREITNASAELSGSTTDLSQRTEEQAASLEQTSASMEEISATVRKNAENAQQANQSANNTREVADRGGQVVAKAVEAMARIEESSRKISDIIGVIDEIARQTNLLALNAAVEAARAGEAGRGFAVVASEVRSLAQRSSQAAKDIKDLITNSNTQVKDGVDLVNRAGAALHEIVDSIKQVVQIVSDIAHASAEQATGLEEVNKALTQMDEVTQQNSALVEENAATSKTLEQQAKVMDERVAAFRIDGGAATAVAAPVRVQRPLAQPSRGPAAKSPPIVTPRRAAVAAPKRAVAGANGGGPVGRMQAAIATAVNADDDWKEF
jgi:methyl-accepting chemotaxis protein